MDKPRPFVPIGLYGCPEADLPMWIGLKMLGVQIMEMYPDALIMGEPSRRWAETARCRLTPGRCTCGAHITVLA